MNHCRRHKKGGLEDRINVSLLWLRGYNWFIDGMFFVASLPPSPDWHIVALQNYMNPRCHLLLAVASYNRFFALNPLCDFIRETSFRGDGQSRMRLYRPSCERTMCVLKRCKNVFVFVFVSFILSILLRLLLLVVIQSFMAGSRSHSVKGACNSC